ncbi:FAEL298Cp [Eremothecium gossypii FDAG1]|nr:FAEL298Cp [Eremothecium gossypii FDAG1]
MLSSIAIDNQHADKTLPPLLLLPPVIHTEAQAAGGTGATTPVSSYDAGLAGYGAGYEEGEADAAAEHKPVSPYSETSTTSSSLERLAFLATRKGDGSGQYGAAPDAYYVGRQAPAYQKPFYGGTVAPGAARSLTPNGAPRLQYEATYNTPRSPESARGVSMSPLMPESASGFQRGDVQRTGSPPNSLLQEPTVITASKYKRQRTGPSCDICRSKKIKCDATITILFQDASVTGSFNEMLHAPVNVSELANEWLSQIPDEVRQALLTKELTLLKHVDKLIAFKPCTSCSKRKNCFCTFSKGFTRADINVYTNLCVKFGKRSSIDQFSLNDYRNCGYQV